MLLCDSETAVELCDGLTYCMHCVLRLQVYGQAAGVLDGVPVAGILGDQQAALFGQVRCFR
jgi:glycerol kinase